MVGGWVSHVHVHVHAPGVFAVPASVCSTPGPRSCAAGFSRGLTHLRCLLKPGLPEMGRTEDWGGVGFSPSLRKDFAFFRMSMNTCIISLK